jgi:outer membrane protein OmpA-like peptidoglycan-associated protein
VVEPKSQRKEMVLKGNENVTVRAINQSGIMRLECDLVGYRKIVQVMNFKYPDSLEGVTIDNNRITVPFFLVRLKKGDHSILYNVFFYKDAAIMRPESKLDLDGLLAMMNENPNYKIRIHGHTNGGASGPILESGESGNIFSMTGAKEGSGSAKKLSEKRANVIRDYLVQNGVDPGRMAVKAWGGKKPIYDKHHTQAQANVRVEVEVIEE